MTRPGEWLLLSVCTIAALFAPELQHATGLSITLIQVVVGTAMLALVLRGWLFPSTDPLLRQLEWTANKTPSSPADYQRCDLGPRGEGSPGSELYLDLLERALVNVIYEDVSMMIYNEKKQPRLAQGFELAHRIVGQDVPWQAHTMVGIRRLRNLRQVVQTILEEKVPGDLIELGVLRGGASIYLRGILKAHGDSQRKVFACDTYCPRAQVPGWQRNLFFPLVSVLAKIPIRRWRRRLCIGVLRRSGSFPMPENPSEDLIDAIVFGIQQANLMSWHRGTSVPEVQSHFARYGLWDDQVVMLKGFFSDTLPTAPIQQIALMRLDGDIYESTRDVLNLLYDKLAPGGFCVVDDYGAFVDCQRAIEEFRTTRGIKDPIVPIDQFGIYWRKT